MSAATRMAVYEAAKALLLNPPVQTGPGALLLLAYAHNAVDVYEAELRGDYGNVID